MEYPSPHTPPRKVCHFQCQRKIKSKGERDLSINLNLPTLLVRILQISELQEVCPVVLTGGDTWSKVFGSIVIAGDFNAFKTNFLQC